MRGCLRQVARIGVTRQASVDITGRIGGKAGQADGRAAAEEVIATMPDVLVSVRAQRAFLGRAVHYLVAEPGIRQFLDIGTGLPAASNTHEVAQRAAPEFG